MNRSFSVILAITSGAIFCGGCASVQDRTRHGVDAPVTKEVLLQEEGQERHWVMRSAGLITEEHYLTAHGDLHIAIEYPKGVHNPQVDSKEKDEQVESVVKAFWPNGKAMSLTPLVGEKANGRDIVCWPNGKTAREALFVMGVPSGAWKFYDESGGLVGEGRFENGKRRDGIFIGNDRPGTDSMLRGDLRKQTFEGGELKHEEGLVEEDFMEKHFSAETRERR